MPGITILGLGPGDPATLTREAWELLSHADEIWLRTGQHPVVDGLPGSLHIHTFDQHYEKEGSFENVYAIIVEKILELGQREQGVIYAVPGDPFVAEATGPEIAARARTLGLPLRIVSGISFLEPVFSALGIDPYPHLVLVDAMELSAAHVPAFSPEMPALVAQVYSRLVAAEVKMTLNTVYPDSYPVRLVHAAGTKDEIIEELPLYEIDRSSHIGLLTVLYVPPFLEGTSFETFQEIIAHLRAPDGCPWDREQTHSTLRTHLLEESYEAITAIDEQDLEKMAEEFGDLLLQIVLHAQIANEAGEFNMTDILKGIHDKIVRRHPHVFGEVELDGVKGVLQNWEKLKEREREDNGEKEKGVLDGVPLSLPSLAQAQKYQDRAARVGFDWPVIDGVLDKVAEEIQEIKAAINPDELTDELGDLFFVLVNLARWKQVDAESALRQTNLKFKQRFSHIEAMARKHGRKLTDMTLDEMENLWQDAKRFQKDS